MTQRLDAMLTAAARELTAALRVALYAAFVAAAALGYDSFIAEPGRFWFAVLVGGAGVRATELLAAPMRKWNGSGGST